MSWFKGLTLNGKYFTREWLLDNADYLSTGQFTKHEHKTLTICSQWLQEQQEFSVQTSGSTGTPKSIHLTRNQMTFSARMTAKALELNAGDRAFVCMAPDYIGGIMMLVRGLVLNLELTVVEPASNPFESINTQIENIAPFDFTALVPLQLQTILNSNANYVSLLNKMKAILLGGAPISLTLSRQLKKVTAPVYQTFGMTETVSHIALRRLNGGEASERYQVLPGVEIGQDPRGCLTIKSVVTNNRQIVTNDIVDIKTGESFVWSGRIDNVINTGGVKVQAEKVERAIEEALLEIEGGKFAEAAFFVGPLPDEKYGQVVIAVFEGSDVSNALMESFRNRLPKKLNKYEVPKRFQILKCFIRTPSGKINKLANLKKILDSN